MRLGLFFVVVVGGKIIVGVVCITSVNFIFIMDPKLNTLTLTNWDNKLPVFNLKDIVNTKIPAGDYKLKDGNFPLLTVDDLYENSKKYHTLVSLDGSNEYKIKVTGFDVGCNSNDYNQKYGGCKVDFEDPESNGGRGRPSKKRPTTPRRRSSKARKSRKSRKARTTRRK